MNPRVCICCGEPMAENNHGLSRNPNVCASCSSMADGIAETEALPERAATALDLSSVPGPIPPTPEPREQVIVEWSSGRLLKRE